MTAHHRLGRLPAMTDATIGRVAAILDDHLATLERTRADLVPVIAELGEDLCSALERGGKLVTFGNGGSAADAQHFAAELTGHFVLDRGPLPGIALTVDTSALTAIANDYAYAEVFARQAAALVGPDDLVVAISTSGKADSVIRGARAAADRGARVWALTGGTGGGLKDAAHRALIVPSSETARIQEVHITVIHAVCSLVDDWVAART
jgi:D-sedoheptulose 7-phosphate isomerase